MSLRAAVAATLAVVALSAGCRSYDGPDEGASGRAAGLTTTTAGRAASTTSTTGPGGGAAPSTAAPRPTTAQAGTSATSAPTGETSQDEGAVAFARPGTYRYSAMGTFMSSITGPQQRDGESILTVDSAAGADQHSVRRGPGRTVEQVLRLEGGNAYLVALRMEDLGLSKEVRPVPPALALPAGASPGRTWSWHASSTDGRTQVSSTFKAVRIESVRVGSSNVDALVVEAVLSTTGDVELTSNQLMWVVPRLGLIVRQDDATDGRFGAITFNATSSHQLVSIDPA